MPSSMVASARPVSSAATSRKRASAGSSGARVSSARRLTRMTCGSSAAQTAPWGAGEHAADRRGEAVHGAEPGVGQAQAAEQARQRQVLAIGGRDRAPPAPARRRRGAARAPSGRSPRARAVGDRVGARRENGSMSCDSASRPLLAITAAGRPTSRSGSTIAARGSMSGLRRLAFTRCSGDASTAFLVTSEPVPAVVGSAMKGSDRRARAAGRAPPPPGSRADRRRCRPAPRWPCRRRARCRRRTRSPDRSRRRAPARRRVARHLHRRLARDGESVARTPSRRERLQHAPSARRRAGR